MNKIDASTNKKSMIKMMLISLAPILAFIFVDEYYGPKAGVIAGISLGLLETIFLYKDKNDYQFIHPDAWQEQKKAYKDYNAIELIKLAPLSLFQPGRYIKAETVKG